MKTKKVFTANLVPGMVIAEAAYTTIPRLLKI